MSVYDLTGRKALVTGGARGLGEGMARALARAGAAVVIGDIREDLGKSATDELRTSGAKAEFVSLDVSAEASWAQAVPQAIAFLGGLDILVNNAGVEITSLLVDIDPADVRTIHQCPGHVSPASHAAARARRTCDQSACFRCRCRRSVGRRRTRRFTKRAASAGDPGVSSATARTGR